MHRYVSARLWNAAITDDVNYAEAVLRRWRETGEAVTEQIFIPTPATVTAEWLTEQLQRAGYAGARVAGFRASRIGTGQIGLCQRLELDIEGAPDAPRTLVGKFPSDDETSRATGVALRNYLKEVSF
ncbi:MAG TPA: hypothetical protein DCR65_07440, partial [Gammaproteobacteria bacterium]|nr:hypothetical protein [Gammaproteobacteria bacterium]